MNQTESKARDKTETPEASSPDGKGGKLGLRLLTGFSLAGLSIVLVVWDPLAIALEILVLALIGIAEFYDLSERKNLRPSRATGFLAVVLLIFSALLGWESYLLALLAGIVLISMLGYIFRKGFHVSSFLDVGATVLGFMYVGWFLSYVIFIRNLPGPSVTVLGVNMDRGAGYVLMLLFSTHLTDTGAFFIGRSFGRHKLAAHISPKKTVEGSIGGIAGALAGAFLIGNLLKMHTVDIVTIGILCGVFSQLGDLWASVLKRDVNAKDSGTVLAGHGGVLDRIDSLLFTAPVVYFYIKFFL